jgi:glutaredoxin 3
MIEIFGKDECPYCDFALKKAQKDGKEYVYKKLGYDFTREELFEQFPTARTFPQIKIDGVAIGGWEAFKAVG